MPSTPYILKVNHILSERNLRLNAMPQCCKMTLKSEEYGSEALSYAYSVVDCLVHILVAQVDRIDRQGFRQLELGTHREKKNQERIGQESGNKKWTYHKHEQSKFIKSHLFGHRLNESAYLKAQRKIREPERQGGSVTHLDALEKEAILIADECATSVGRINV